MDKDEGKASTHDHDAVDCRLGIRMFGGFEVRLDGIPLVDLKAREGERLLAYLVLQRGRPVSASAVAELFWPETGSTDSLRHSVRVVRAALGDEGNRLEAPRGLLRFRTEGANIDLVTFDRYIAAPDAASRHHAIDAYTGPLLPEWRDRWVTPHRESRRERFLDALDALAAVAEEREDYQSAARILRRYIRANASEERAWRQLMRVLVLAGERVAALDLYHRYRDHLSSSYHIDPPAEMTALAHDISESAQPYAHTVAGAEPVGGAVPPGSPMYVVRSADDQFLPAIERQDSIVLVKGPRQTGKSSLLAHGLSAARRQGKMALVTDFQQFTSADMLNMETLCLRLAASLAAQMDLRAAPEDVWKQHLGPGPNLERYLLKHALASVAPPVVWGLDEMDRIFSHPYHGEFFSLLRSWHEKRSFDPARPWKRLTLAIACATEAHLYIADLNHSPFNVGTHLTIGDFTRHEVEDLNTRHGSVLSTPDEITRFYEGTGGHPYLVRRGLQAMAVHGASFEALAAAATGEDSPFADHLCRLVRMVSADPDLLTAVRAVLDGRACSEVSFSRLRSAGVLAGDTHGDARLRCRLYAKYLRMHL